MEPRVYSLQKQEREVGTSFQVFVKFSQILKKGVSQSPSPNCWSGLVLVSAHFLTDTLLQTSFSTLSVEFQITFVALVLKFYKLVIKVYIVSM